MHNARYMGWRETVPSPACRGGLGWGASAASGAGYTPPTTARFREIWPRAKAQATPPQPFPTVAGEGAYCGRRGDFRSNKRLPNLHSTCGCIAE